MKSIRAAIKVFCLIIWFVLMGIIGFFLALGNKWKSIKRLSHGAKLWSKGNAAIVFLKIHYLGTKPKLNGIIVSNHMSYLDIITTSCTFNIRFAPNTDIAKWPILGQYLSLSKPIWVDRNSRQNAKDTMNAFVDTASHNVNLLVFPEGKISDCKNGLQSFKSTVFEASIRGKVPIIPIILHYHNKDVCWTKWKLPKHIWHVLKLKIIDVDVHFLTPIIPKTGETRKELSERVFEIMNTKYKDLYC